jgi:hypothetical protein
LGPEETESEGGEEEVPPGLATPTRSGSGHGCDDCEHVVCGSCEEVLLTPAKKRTRCDECGRKRLNRLAPCECESTSPSQASTVPESLYSDSPDFATLSESASSLGSSGESRARLPEVPDELSSAKQLARLLRAEGVKLVDADAAYAILRAESLVKMSLIHRQEERPAGFPLGAWTALRDVATGPSLAELWDADLVQDTPVTLDLTPLPPVHPDHPYAPFLTPRAGFVTMDGRASMLFHRLPEKATNAEEAVKALRARMDSEAQNLTVLLAVSGAGKTRTLLECLCSRHGIYFDFDSASPLCQEDCREFLRLCRLMGGADATELTQLATRWTSLLILSRLYLLDYLRRGRGRAGGIELTPKQWTIAQVQRENGALFARIFERFLSTRSSHLDTLHFVNGRVAAAQAAAPARSRRQGATSDRLPFPVAIDEIMFLLDESTVRFASGSRSADSLRSAFTPVCQVLHSDIKGVHTLLAGTSIRTRRALAQLRSAIAKPQVPFEDLYFTSFSRFVDATAVRNYMNNINAADKETGKVPVGGCDAELRQLVGRPRFAARSLEILLDRATSDTPATLPASQADAMRDAIRTVIEEQCRPSTPSEHRTLYDSLAGIVAKTGTAGREYVSHFEVLSNLIMAYVLLGDKLCFSTSDHQEYVDGNICHLTEDGEGVRVLESLVVSATVALFKRERLDATLSLVGIIAKAFLPGSSRGYLVEMLLPAACRTLLTKTADVRAHRLFRKPLYDGTLPDWFRGPITLADPFRRCFASLHRYLDLRVNEGDFVLPETAAGPDLAFKFKVGNSTRLCLLQSKYYSGGLPRGEQDHAMATTDPSTLYCYTSSKGGRLATCEQRKVGVRVAKIADDKYARQSGCLRILFVLTHAQQPRAAKNGPSNPIPRRSTTMGSDVVLVIDQTNLHHFLPEYADTLLSLLSKGACQSTQASQ